MKIQAERQSSGSLCRGSPSPQSRECFPLGVIEWKLVPKILQLSLNCLSPVLGFFFDSRNAFRVTLRKT